MSDIFRFPYTFNVEQTKQQLLNFADGKWIAHYNKKDYVGDWNVLALRSGWGHPENIYSVPMPADNYKDTPLLDFFPEVRNILNHLACDKTSVRFMRLCAGAEIKEHCDDELDITTSKEARLHVPVQTHDQVEFYLNNKRVMMKEGECWYLNFNLPHSVKNSGTTDRIHLVIDCVVNDWLLQQMNLPVEHVG
ncbi:MAG: aspartyl/asparaginyl beta-hydroxylase domain-containing protein [Bacteroidia bacterium]|nr:aspartyl/asparaginyl beta-hydroxylase domain-containing protein [Bacteroidia bacterium]MBP9180128.1 aspartyl/asparaginyl beta-hydroxylase domain-containing protein [Bacteroidia bacterium]MBP9725297.1 aspartyl/asparaginyl beta-hydroxylase domain-containing protein [Bacteroidia bacterium]